MLLAVCPAGAAAGSARTVVKLALGLAAVRTRRNALFGWSLAKSFRPIWRADRAASSFVALRRTVVAPLSVAILRVRAMGGMALDAMRVPLLTGITILAALALVAAIGLSECPFGTL